MLGGKLRKRHNTGLLEVGIRISYARESSGMQMGQDGPWVSPQIARIRLMLGNMLHTETSISWVLISCYSYNWPENIRPVAYCAIPHQFTGKKKCYTSCLGSPSHQPYHSLLNLWVPVLRNHIFSAVGMYRIDHCVAGCMTHYLPRENYLPQKPRKYRGRSLRYFRGFQGK